MSELMNVYNKERTRLKAACGKFITVKEPSECFKMMMMHTMGLRAELNTLIECLNKKTSSDQTAYFTTLVKQLQLQTEMLCAGLPGVVIDEDGRVHDLIRPSNLG